MNNLIRVEDVKLYLAKNYIDGKKSLGQCLDEVPTVNAIEIPYGATNGDVMKAVFPNFSNCIPNTWSDAKYVKDGD